MPFLSLGRKKHHLGLLLFTRENSQNRCVFGPRIQGRILQFWCFQNQPKHTKNGVFGTPKKHALSQVLPQKHRFFTTVQNTKNTFFGCSVSSTMRRDTTLDTRVVRARARILLPANHNIYTQPKQGVQNVTYPKQQKQTMTGLEQKWCQFTKQGGQNLTKSGTKMVSWNTCLLNR